MLKSAIALGFVMATVAFVPARAADTMMCDEAGMGKMQTSAMGMTDNTRREMAMKEMAMAKESMAKKNDKDCMMHMQKMHGMM